MIDFQAQESGLEHPEGGMMPMVDVIFTLIAFMMLIINAPQMAMEIELPSAGPTLAQPVEEQGLTLTVIAQTPEWQLNDGPRLDAQATRTALRAWLNQQPQPTITLLQIDRQAPTQRVVDTLELLAELGIDDARIVLRQESTHDR